MTHCNVCYHEITHAFWELGNTALLVPSAHQEELSHDNKISNPKCLIPATKWQGHNKQLLHCYERSRSFPLTETLVIDDVFGFCMSCL